MWVMEFNLGLLEEQPGPLTPELSLQPPPMSLIVHVYYNTIHNRQVVKLT